MEQRIAWVDYAKAVGIILVVYGHVTRGIFKAGIGSQDGLYRLIDSVIYSFHMPLFFFLSGIFFEKSILKNSGAKLMLHKLDTIAYPYLAWSVFQGTVEVCLSGHTNGNASFSEVFSLFSAPRSQFWFLYALFVNFAVVAMIYSVVGVRRGGIASAIVSVLIYSAPGLMPNSSIYPFVSEYLVFFCFGIVFANHRNRLRLTNSGLLLFSVPPFLIGQCLFHSHFTFANTDKGIASLALALVTIVFVTALCGEIAKIPSKVVTAIGNATMAIFLMHILIGSGARIILLDFFRVDSLWAHIVVGCVAGIFIPIFIFSILTRFKIPLVFSAPISVGITTVYRRIVRRS